VTTTIFRVHGTNFITGFAGVEMGCGGPDVKSGYTIIHGPNEYLWSTKNDGSTGAGVDCGIDPGTYVAELAGYTGIQVAYPAGLVTSGSRATIMAAALALRPWCTSATVAVADNPNRSRSIRIVGTYTSITPGSRTWLSRGAAGQWGSHVFRRSPEIVGAASTVITRNLASVITVPPANAQPWGVGLQLGAVVSALAGNRPRIYLRVGGTAIDPTGSTVLFDFGQIPVSQMIADSLAMITLTPAQVVALRAALNTVGASALWVCVESIAITQYISLPNGGGWNGQMPDSNLRVDVATSSDPTNPPPVAWNSVGMLSISALLSFRFFYDIDPAGNAESHPVWGSLRDLSTFPNVVVLPNTETLQTALSGTGYEGYTIENEQAFIVAGTTRYCFDQGGNPAVPDMSGATTILDFGAMSSTGLVTITAPTGDASIAVPAVLSTRFKGNGASGRGALNPLNNTPIQPNDFIRRSDGRNPYEQDYVAPGGDPNTPFASPIVALATAPDNLPALRATLLHPADEAEQVIEPASASWLRSAQVPTVQSSVVIEPASASWLRSAQVPTVIITPTPPPPPPPPPPPLPSPSRVVIRGSGGGGGYRSINLSKLYRQDPVRQPYVIVQGPIGLYYAHGYDPILVKIISKHETQTGTVVEIEAITEEEAIIPLDNAERFIADNTFVDVTPVPARNPKPHRRIFGNRGRS